MVKRLTGISAVLIFVAFGTGRFASAQSSAQLFVRSDTVSVGDRFPLSFVVERPVSGTLVAPDPAAGDSTLGDLEVLELNRYAEPVAGDESRVRDSLAYLVTTFALDSAVVPPGVLHVVAGGDTTTIPTPGAVIPVRSLVPEGTEDVRDLAPLVEFPRARWPWILLAVAVLLAAILGYLWYRRRQSSEELAPPPSPPVPPYEEAITRLEHLHDIPLEEAQHVKPYYVELSDILRTYLERRTGVPALERTTRELMRELERMQSAGFPSTVVARTRLVLERADLVKFADARPPAEQGREAASETRQVVEEVEQLKRRSEAEAAAPVEN